MKTATRPHYGISGRGELDALAGSTTVLTVGLPRETVFRQLADIEELPRWAGGFCEAVYLCQGRWMGLTSLGELFLDLEADWAAGSVVLRAGWSPRALRRLPLHVEGLPGGRASRVVFSVRRLRGASHARLCRALHGGLSDWVAQLGSAALAVGAPSAG